MGAVKSSYQQLSASVKLMEEIKSEINQTTKNLTY